MTSFRQIHIADADPSALAVYRQAMAAVGAGSPALFFRYVVTYPGLLDWVWSAVGPDIAAGWPSWTVWKIVADQPVVELPGFSMEALVAKGLDDTARRTIREMPVSYNRMDSTNFTIVGTIHGLVAGNGPLPPRTPYSEEPCAPPAAKAELPRPRRPEDLGGKHRAAVLAACRTHRPIAIGGQRVAVPPTLYLHAALARRRWMIRRTCSA